MEIKFMKNDIYSYKDTRMIEKVDTLYQNNETRPVVIERIRIETPPSSAVVYKLFRYFDVSVTECMRQHCENVVRSLEVCCAPLKPEVEKRRDIIEDLFKTFVRRMILELLCHDDRGVKIRQILSQFDALYFFDENRMITKGLMDFDNVATIESLFARTTEESNRPIDEFYRKHSGRKDRGRKPVKEKKNKPHRVDAIKANYILSTKQLPPVRFDEESRQFFIENNGTFDKTTDISHCQVDFYPIFRRVLNVFNATINRRDNHGVYLTKLYDAMKRLSAREWPMKGLIGSIINMERVLGKHKIRVPDNGITYYCAYSGLPLKSGEEVWYIRILVNDTERYKKWRMEGRQPTVPNTSEELTRSLKVYFMKTSITSQCSLFYTPLALSSRTSIYAGRRHTCNKLYRMFSHLQWFIHHHGMERCVWFGNDTRSYIDHIHPLSTILYSLPDSQQFDDTLLQFVFAATMMDVFGMDAYTREDVMRYCLCLRDIVIDFIDNLVSEYDENDNEWDGLNIPDIPVSTPLHHVNDNASNIITAFVKLSNTRPKLDANERRQRQQRLSLCLGKHPYLFISIFNTIYSIEHPSRTISFNEASLILSFMNLFVNTQSSRANQ